MRFHAVPPFHTAGVDSESGCPFTQKARIWCRMMKHGSGKAHTIVWYGNEDADVDADEKVAVTTRQELRDEYAGAGHLRGGTVGDLTYTRFNKRTILAMRDRVQPGDVVVCFYGIGAADVARACVKRDDVRTIEYGVGNFQSQLPGTIRTYESYACLHYYMGRINKEVPSTDDCVVPPVFNLASFEYNPQPSDYFLFIGRIARCKGVHVALDLAAEMGFHLKVAGDDSAGLAKTVAGHKNIEFVGYVSGTSRSELFRGAKGLIMPTQYIEPFGYTMMEAMMCGCPVISTDYGSFSEHIVQGFNGFRCRTPADFRNAVRNIGQIDRANCRAYAEKFDIPVSKQRNEAFFESLMAVPPLSS
jgi:glycosyltransferase involved in cell wall biosynthesis